jgi:SSS family solute:Na+ symporter
MIIGVCCISAPLLLLKAELNLSSIPSDMFSFPISNSIGIISAASFFFMMMMPHIVGPDIYSKILAARNEDSAKKGVILSGVLRFIFAISIAIIGISAVVLVPNLPAKEAVFAMPLAITQLGPILSGLILAAFVSVMLSSADSVLLSAGTVLSVDIIKKQSIRISRIGIFIMGFLALFLALYLNDIIETLKLAYTVFTSGLTFPILFGFYKEKTHVSSKGAIISLCAGGGISLIWFFLQNPFNIDAVIIGMISSIIPLLIIRE